MQPVSFVSLRRTFTVFFAVSALASTVFGDVIYESGTSVFVDEAIGQAVGIRNSSGGDPTTVTFGSNTALTGDNFDDDSLFTEGSSVAIINGGSISNDISSYDQSRIEINGGTFSDDIYVTDNGYVQMNGGTLAEDIVVWGPNASMEINGGNIGRDITVGFGNLVISGGTLVFGGSGNLIDGILVGDGGVVDFVGTALFVDGMAVTGTVTQLTGELSGTLADGSTFSGFIFDRGPGGAVTEGTIRFTAVPEPSLAGLTVLLPFFVFRRRGQQGSMAPDFCK